MPIVRKVAMWKKVGESENGKPIYDPNQASALGDGDSDWFVIVVILVILACTLCGVVKIASEIL